MYRTHKCSLHVADICPYVWVRHKEEEEEGEEEEVEELEEEEEDCCVLPRAYPSLFVHIRYVCMLCMLSLYYLNIR